MGSPAVRDLSHQLVLDYLRLSGRTRAARYLEKELDVTGPSQVTDKDEELGEIRRHILQGDIQGAVEAINDALPELLDSDESLMFRLKLQAFVELLRSPGYDLKEALAFAAEELVPCPPDHRKALEETMALMAFENPIDSPLKHVFDRQKGLAHEVNRRMLKSQGIAGPRLDETLREATWLHISTHGNARNSPDATGKPGMEGAFSEFF